MVKGKTMKKHVNIPIFIPHMGCPNDCVFCNQRTISGRQSFDVSTVEKQIKEALATVSVDTECEIAFFGGSFTGIDRGLMIHLLDVAKKYTDSGMVSGIRLSTRPDYINDEILDILSGYKISAIELGLQSMCDEVLLATKRGHNARCAESACRLIKDRGFCLVGQMMIGLPESDVHKEIYTAKKICELGADGARIYPTVVFRETELCEMTKRGEYAPIDEDDAVVRTKEALKVFEEHGVPCIRVGLCASDNLSDDSEVYGGANHSAIGELSMGELYYDRICEELDKLENLSGKNIVICCSRGSTSKVSGQNKRNKTRISEKYGVKSIKILEKSEILGYNIILYVV